MIGLGIFTTLIITFLPVSYLVYLITNNDYPMWTLAAGFAWSVLVILCIIGLYYYAKPQTKNKKKDYLPEKRISKPEREGQWTKL